MASEKLKALDVAMTNAASREAFGEYRRALPQIVALVKAAQDVVENHSEFTPGTQIARALAALDEVLAL